MTNNFLKICAAACVASVMSLHADNADATTTCGPTSTAISHTGNGNAANGDDAYCYKTPDVLQLKFYEFGLCTGNASPTNRENCTPVFKSSAGKNVNVSQGGVSDLINQATLTEGTYTHGYLVVSNTVEINLTMQFSTARKDDQFNLNRTDGHSGEGEYCFTDGRSINSSNSIMSCDTSPSPSNSPETMSLNGCAGGYTSSYPGYQYSAQGVTITTDLYMVNNAGGLSNSCVNDFAFFAVQPFYNPVTITGETSGLDVAIGLSGGVSMGFMGVNNATAPTDAMFNGLQFVITEN